MVRSVKFLITDRNLHCKTRTKAGKFLQNMFMPLTSIVTGCTETSHYS